MNSNRLNVAGVFGSGLGYLKKFYLFYLVFALLFVWSIGNTVALRNALIALSLVGLLPLFGMLPRLIRQSHAQIPWLWFGILTLWLIVQAVVFSPETGWALDNLKGQWIKAALCLLLGYGLVFSALRKGIDRSLICLLIAGALGLECLVHALDSIWLWIQNGTPPFSISRLTGSKERISYVNNLFFSILAAEVVARLNGTQRILPVHRNWLVVSAVVVYFNSWVIGARNGEVGALAITVSAAFLILVAQRHRLGVKRLVFAGLSLFTAVSILGYMGYKSDGRWSTLLEQAEIGWQTEAYHYWINTEKFPRPLDKYGNEVSLSNYERIAWIKEGVKIIGDTPWGVGYGRTAFGHALLKRYPQYEPRIGMHSHSGIIDWTIGTGWLGLALWLIFLGVGGLRGLRGYVKASDPVALMLLFVVTGYFSRSLVDSNIRDHMLEQFMFLYGFFYALTCCGQEPKTPLSSVKMHD